MSRFAQSCQIGIKQASEEYWSSSVTKSWATVTYAKQVTIRKGNFVHQRILLRWFSMFCVSRNAYKMIIFAHSKCKRYENRKIQGVALPEKERNGQEWKSSHHGTHHGEQDYGAVLLTPKTTRKTCTTATNTWTMMSWEIRWSSHSYLGMQISKPQLNCHVTPNQLHGCTQYTYFAPDNRSMVQTVTTIPTI